MGKQLKVKVDKIVSLLAKQYQPEKVILFGSAATGLIHQDGDVDLVVIKKTDRRFYDRIGDVLHILWSGEETPKIGVDVLVYTPKEFQEMSRQNCFIRDEVLGKGRILYERPIN